MPGHKLSSPRRRTKCPARERERVGDREAACQLDRICNRSQTKQSSRSRSSQGGGGGGDRRTEKKEDRGQENRGQAKQAGEAAVNNRISVSDGHRRWTRRGAQKQKCARSFDNCQMQWATGCRGKRVENREGGVLSPAQTAA